MAELLTLADIATAAERVRPHVARTPIIASPGLSDQLGCEVHGKVAAEPAAAVSIAAITTGAITVEPDEVVCIIVTGGNADLEKLHQAPGG